MNIEITQGVEYTTLSIDNAGSVWGTYTAPNDHLKIWTPGRALTRLVDADDGHPENILDWAAVHASGPVGRAATIVAAASLWSHVEDLGEYEHQVVTYFPDEDVSRWALEQITKAHLARGHA